MKVLLNCSLIKNVAIVYDRNILEIGVFYIGKSEKPWCYNRDLHVYANEVWEEEREKFKTAYDTIKNALLNGEKFVEIEL